MTIIGLIAFGAASSIASFLITVLGTRYLISYLPSKKMTVADYHKDGKPPIPRPGGPAIIADLKGEQSRVDVEGEVIEKGETRTVNLRAGGQS
ncbi:MAG: hypothetical protein JRN15_23545, partial [Nitrososphaerota archaeon]|nr:hypothetical protein [Nitrososphaerota archaeon]